MSKVLTPAEVAFNGRLVDEARMLKSENGENPEYDRALVELVTTMLGLSMDDAWSVAILLGTKWGRQ